MKKTRQKVSPSVTSSEWMERSKDLPATQSMLSLVRTELKSDIRGLKAEMTSKFEQVLSEVSRVGLLVEEQNSKNNIVLEGLTGLWERQQRVEARVEGVEKTVHSIARSRV